MRTVGLKNVSEDVFIDKFNGHVYKIKPGQTVLVPEGVAKHWVGDWEATGKERDRELERAAFRRGGSPPPLQVVDQDDGDDNVEEDAPPTEEEEDYLKSIREGAYYVFPDGERIRKKVDALEYLRKTAAG